MLRQIKQKTKDHSAFTIAETLVAILILLMVSSVVAAGIPAARNAYENVEMTANAELLLSSTISTLRNELSLAKDVKIKDITVTEGESDNDYSDAIEYVSPYTGSGSQIYKHSDGVIMFNRYANTDMSIASGKPERLIAPELSTKVGLEITYKSVSKKNGYILFEDLEVTNGIRILTSRSKVSIRIVSY